MRKILTIVVCTLLATTSLFAQSKKKDNAKTVDITISANNNEVFTVYLDGESKSDAPGKQCVIKGLKPNRLYDLVVYVEEPIKYMAGADMELGAGHYELVVYSDPVDKYAEILFANDISTLARQSENIGGGKSKSSDNDAVCSETDISSILVMFSQEPFDDTRLHYVKSIMPNKNQFLVSQIRRIAEAFAYDNARVKFMKYGYDYCADKDNYASLSDVLTDKTAKEDFEKFLKSKGK